VGGETLANLQIKGIQDDLYQEIKKMAAAEGRHVSQQILFLVRDYLAKKGSVRATRTTAQVLLELSGSWEDRKDADQIIAEISHARKNSTKLAGGF
jgi:hypothetical protein